jgi:dTDP-4-dehydrorhamnose 3,5-epimerase
LIKHETPFEGVFLMENTVAHDTRGSFQKLYCDLEIPELKMLNQVNVVANLKVGIIRGLHFQIPPFEENKLVTVLHGSIFDVIVDLRPKSSTYLTKFEIILSAEKNHSLFIPKGFAHGYQTLSAKSEILYLHSGHHNPQAESGINYADEELSIEWPLPTSEISNRDRNFTFMSSRRDIF